MVRLAGSSGARQRQELHRHGLAGSRATMPLMDQEVFGTMSAPAHVELCATLLSSLKLLHVKLTNCVHALVRCARMRLDTCCHRHLHHKAVCAG